MYILSGMSSLIAAEISFSDSHTEMLDNSNCPILYWNGALPHNYSEDTVYTFELYTTLSFCPTTSLSADCSYTPKKSGWLNFLQPADKWLYFSMLFMLPETVSSFYHYNDITYLRYNYIS